MIELPCEPPIIVPETNSVRVNEPNQDGEVESNVADENTPAPDVETVIGEVTNTAS